MSAGGRSEIAISLAEAAARFLASLSGEEREKSQLDVQRFVRWCGRERLLAELKPHDVARYPEEAGIPLGDKERLEPVRAFLLYAKKERWLNTNLATHLRLPKAIGKGKARTRAPAAEVSLTQEGYQRLQADLSKLHQERVHLTEEVSRAMADKDFRENAPLDSAREQRGFVEGRIRELEETLGRATLMGEAARRTQARIGSRIVLQEMASGRKLDYVLVDPPEANPSQGKLSVSSPVGRALLERREGEEIEVAVPRGLLRYRILGIE